MGGEAVDVSLALVPRDRIVTVVPIARTFPLAEAPAALDLLRTTHPGGKLALVPEGRPVASGR